jgi:hypothetical protein
MLIADIGAPSAPTTTTITIDRKLAKKIGKLLQDHLTTRTKPLDAARRLFESTLAALIRPFFDTLEDLDAILEDTNN